MRRLVILLLLATAGAAAYRRLGQKDDAAAGQADSLTVRQVPPSSGPSGQTEAARLARLRLIAEGNTYFAATLTELDSLVRRWDLGGRPLRVYYEPATVASYTPALGRAARDAFSRWSRVGGLPVDFQLARRPDEAEVTVRFSTSLPDGRAGQADMEWLSDGRMQRGTLTLATLTPNRQPLAVEEVFSIALHEIGHLLGLGHSDEPRDVMFPTAHVHDLTIRDRRTAMLLYSLPPGSLKAPGSL